MCLSCSLSSINPLKTLYALKTYVIYPENLLLRICASHFPDEFYVLAVTKQKRVSGLVYCIFLGLYMCTRSTSLLLQKKNRVSDLVCVCMCVCVCVCVYVYVHIDVCVCVCV